MIVSLPSRGISAAALAAGLLLAGCSSPSDVPPTVASAPGGGTQINTDTGSGGEFPNVNTVPTLRPTSTIQDLIRAPDGLAGARSGTQYGEALIGGPTSSAAPPAPPPPPEPTAEELAPIPEAGLQTQSSDTTYQAAAPAEPAAPLAAPEVVEAQPPEPIAEAAPEVVEPQPMEPLAEAAPEGQTIDATEPAPVAAAPEVPATPASPPPGDVQPYQPEDQAALTPLPPAAVQQPQAPAVAYGPDARAPETYGIAVPQPNQPYNPAMTSSPYANPPAGQGGPAFAAPGQPYYGEPVGLIYFRDGSSSLSSDDRQVLRQIADMQIANGWFVSVVGHASMRTDTMDYARHQQANQRISAARAESVAHQLMEYGVPQSAIRIAAVGAAQPLYSEVMPTGEAANRRAEVYLTPY